MQDPKKLSITFAWSLVLSIALTTIASCTDNTQTPANEQPRLTSRLAKPASPSRDVAAAILNENAAGPKTVAVVSGREINTRDFLETLVEARGLPLLQQMIFLEAVRARAEKDGVTISDREIEREYDLTLSEVEGGEEKQLTADQRDMLIDKWCARRRVPREELHIAMTRQALLRNMAEKNVTVTGKLLEQEYNRTYGEKARVRHIQIPSRRSYVQIKRRLDRGEDFTNLVHEFSINAISKADGGLLPPFTRDDPTVPARFVEVAFGLKPGEVSPLFEAEGSYHLIKFEEMVPAQTGNISETRRDLEKSVHQKLVTFRMEALGREILDAAQIRIDENRLRQRYIELKRKGQIAGPELTR